MSQRFDPPLSPHRLSASPMLLQVDYPRWPVHSRVSCSPSFQVLGESMGRIIGIPSIVATIIAKENVHVV